MSKKRARKPLTPPVAVSVTATDAKNEFGRLLDTVIGGRMVVITRHDEPRAVLMSIAEYEALSGKGEAALEAMSREFDTLLTRMQTPEARAAMKRAFEASGAELGQAAVKAARGGA